MNSDSGISIRLCWKFNSFCDIPKEVRSAKDLFRLAFVFGLDPSTSQNHGERDDNEWSSYFQCYVDIVSKLQELVNSDSCTVKCNFSLMQGSPETEFLSIEDYKNAINEMINAGSYDFEAPYRVLLKENQKTVCVVNTEFWIYYGGRYPYSDSYVHSIYAFDETVLNKLEDFILLYAECHGIKVLPEFEEKYDYRQRKNLFRKLLWKILQLFNVFM